MGFIGNNDGAAAQTIIKNFKVNILLTNDDGVDSNITLSLLKALEEDQS